MKKIGIDARFFTEKATGVGRHVFELVNNLSKLDRENEYTIFLKPEEFDNFIIPSPNFKKEITNAKHYSFSEQWNFLIQLNSHNFDLMVFPQFNAPIFYNKPFTVTIHDLTLHLFPGKKKTDIISRLAYKLVINIVTRKAKHCFAVSENTKRDMINFLKTPKEKITVTYNGITQKFQPIKDENILTNFKKEYQLPEKYFLYTGVSRSHKNVLGLIRAYNLFLKKHSESNIYLILAGPQDKTYNEVPSLIKELELDKKIKHLGLFPEKDFSKLISGACAYIFPSFYEGFGIPPLEAMQCGVPVACSNTSSLPEVCGTAAQYFNPYYDEKIMEAMEIIAFDKDKRKGLIEKGFIQCKKFSWGDMGGKMFNIYKKVLDE